MVREAAQSFPEPINVFFRMHAAHSGLASLSRQVEAGMVSLPASGMIHDTVTFAGRKRLANGTLQTEFFPAAGLRVGLLRAAASLDSLVRTGLNPRQAHRIDCMVRLSGRLSLSGALTAAAMART